MVFIRTKMIHGNEYAYRVKSVREDGKVRQKVVEYLGRADEVLGTTENRVEDRAEVGEDRKAVVR